MSLSADTRRNLLLSIFGTVLGCVFALGVYLYMNRLKAGQEFESLDDLRRQMLATSDEKKSGRVDLRDIMNPHPSDTMIYDLRPHLDVVFQGVPTRTNSCGLRYREVSQSKPPNTFRIALLGDSFAFGWGVRIEKSFGHVLEENLNRIASGARSFEVLNFGIPGYSTFQEVSRFEELALDFDPDAVLVYVVENDFGLPFYVRDIENPGRIMPSTVFSCLSWSKSDPRVQEQLDKQRQFGAPRALLRLADLCRERSIPLFIAINPRSRWEQDAKRLGKVRKQPGVKVINMWEDFLRGIRVRNLPDSVLSLPNDPHPSEVKHGVLGEVLTPHFMQFAVAPQP